MEGWNAMPLVFLKEYDPGVSFAIQTRNQSIAFALPKCLTADHAASNIPTAHRTF
jgi:hypothetical protein